MLSVQLSGQKNLTDVIRLVRGRREEQLREGVLTAALPLNRAGCERQDAPPQIAVQSREPRQRAPEIGIRPSCRRPRLISAGVLSLHALQDVAFPVDDVVDLLPYRVGDPRGRPLRFPQSKPAERREESCVSPVPPAERIVEEAEDLPSE